MNIFRLTMKIRVWWLQNLAENNLGSFVEFALEHDHDAYQILLNKNLSIKTIEKFSVNFFCTKSKASNILHDWIFNNVSKLNMKMASLLSLEIEFKNPPLSAPLSKTLVEIFLCFSLFSANSVWDVEEYNFF